MFFSGDSEVFPVSPVGGANYELFDGNTPVSGNTEAVSAPLHSVGQIALASHRMPNLTV